MGGLTGAAELVQQRLGGSGGVLADFAAKVEDGQLMAAELARIGSWDPAHGSVRAIAFWLGLPMIPVGLQEATVRAFLMIGTTNPHDRQWCEGRAREEARRHFERLDREARLKDNARRAAKERRARWPGEVRHDLREER